MEPPFTHAYVLNFIDKTLQQNIGMEADLSPDLTFAALAMDSLDLIELLMEVEEHFGRNLDEKQLAFDPGCTVFEMATRVTALLNG